MIILIVISALTAIYSFYVIIEAGLVLLESLLSAFGLIFIGLSIFFIVKINPKIKELRVLKKKKETKIHELTQEAWQQMKPLNDLLTPDLNIKLFRKTMPLINLDAMFDRRRLDYLVNRFGLAEATDPNRSTLYVQSGDIKGNPFFICNDLVHELGTKTYTGSITIHWTTSRTVNGKRQTQHHTQVLTASIDKPYPYYGEQPYLVYGNDAAPDLIFSREDSDAENLSQKQIDRLVNRNIKKLQRSAEKSVTKGSNYTVLGNSEFEVLFGATNRNNEVQFRLLFTPLAQKQLLQLMKEKEIGFGDNFDFIKYKKINFLYPEHLQNIRLELPDTYFHDFDYETIKERFIGYNNAYFRHIYFAFAPILAIPLYQQQQPHEYIYKDLYDSYVSFYEHERVANQMNIQSFKHPLSVTRNILKTKVINSKDNRDTIQVTAYGYRMEKRISYETRFGGDGRLHRIPIHWEEYIPVNHESMIEIDIPDQKEEMSYGERFKQSIENLRNQQNISQRDIYRVGKFLSYVLHTDKKK